MHSRLNDRTALIARSVVREQGRSVVGLVCLRAVIHVYAAIEQVQAETFCARPQATAKAPATPLGTTFKFDPPGEGCPYKSTGLQKLIGQYTLTYDASKDVPGTGYSDVCPCQTHVNPDIIASKVEEFRKHAGKSPSVPVFINPTSNKLTILGDGHHTFCAALKSSTPIILWLFDAKAFGSLGHRDWVACTYEKFQQQAAAKTGSKYAETT